MHSSCQNCFSTSWRKAARQSPNTFPRKAKIEYKRSLDLFPLTVFEQHFELDCCWNWPSHQSKILEQKQHYQNCIRFLIFIDSVKPIIYKHLSWVFWMFSILAFRGVCSETAERAFLHEVEILFRPEECFFLVWMLSFSPLYGSKLQFE